MSMTSTFKTALSTLVLKTVEKTAFTYTDKYCVNQMLQVLQCSFFIFTEICATNICYFFTGYDILSCDLEDSLEKCILKGSTIREGGDTTISSPGRSSKQPLTGMRLHDPLHGQQPYPEFIALD